MYHGPLRGYRRDHREPIFPPLKPGPAPAYVPEGDPVLIETHAGTSMRVPVRRAAYLVAIVEQAELAEDLDADQQAAYDAAVAHYSAHTAHKEE